MPEEDFDAGRLGLEPGQFAHETAMAYALKHHERVPSHFRVMAWSDLLPIQKEMCAAVEDALATARPEAGWREPDHIYDPDDWDATYNWDDRSIAAENCVTGYVARGGDPFQPKKFCTLNAGAPVWAREIVLTRDDCGDPDETEVRWFKSEEEALACEPCPPTGGKPDA